MRLCFESDEMDPSFESGLSQWHTLCNALSFFAPTTPSISSITTYYDYNNLCDGEACATAKLLFDSCAGTFTDDARYTSCICAPSFLTLDYSCEYLGNTSCEGIPATLSNLIGYGCSNFPAVLSEIVSFELSWCT
jgi:hypothetical protein